MGVSAFASPAFAIDGLFGKSCTESAADAYDRVSPAVVLVTGVSINPYAIGHRVNRGMGSGVLYDDSGLIVTNFHVVFGNQFVTVTLNDGTVVRAEPEGFDAIFDLAILRIPKGPKQTFPTAKLGDSSRVRVGDGVVAIGYPFGLGQTLTRGTISAINRVLPEIPLSILRPMFQTDTSINPGSSGGPLLNLCGEVIGLNTGIIAFAENVGFAVPSNLIKNALPGLMKDGRIVRPWLGFHGQLVDPLLRQILRIPIVSGLLVEVVEPDSPAEQAGIQGGVHEVILDGTSFLVGGDIVTALNGNAINTPDELMHVMQGLKVGDKVRVDIFRGGTTKKIEFVLPERPLLPGDIPRSGVFSSTLPSPVP